MCVVGDAVVDVMMGEPVKMRLGGVFHPARALWATEVAFELLYVAPEYLDSNVETYAESLGAGAVRRIGRVVGAPNVVIVKEPTEAGPQGYEMLMRDSYRCELLTADAISDLVSPETTDILILTGSYPLGPVLDALALTSCRLHIDIANNLTDLSALQRLGRPVDTLITSTSSPLFQGPFDGDVGAMREAALNVAARFLFKENRGGSRLFTGRDDDPNHVGAQLRPVVHSVGVGDCFDAVFTGLESDGDVGHALRIASWTAAEYAATTFVDDFKMNVQRTLALPPEELEGYPGVSLSWEDRPQTNVYVAAPDFDYRDTTLIDAVADALRYHNFTPRLPVRENGQAKPGDPERRRRELFGSDVDMLGECQILLAVLLDGDPGTLVEIGLAAGTGRPVVVYDPHGLAENLMLAYLPSLVSPSLDEVISEVFRLAAGLRTDD